ncbi:exo-alpha-sialidase [Tessaracoccus flavescens]|nr:exo-alpha-sialidase [Tessaracoccus flavescens]
MIHPMAADTTAWRFGLARLSSRPAPEQDFGRRAGGDRPTPASSSSATTARSCHWRPMSRCRTGTRSSRTRPTAEIWLFFKRGHTIDAWTTWVGRSEDCGRTWSELAELVPGDTSGGRGPVRQSPLRIDDAWLAPGSVELWDPPTWDCFIDASTDGGVTWRRTPVPLDHATLRGAGCIQPALVPGTGARLVMLTRSTEGRVFRGATDDPTDWPPLTPTTLPNNNSGIAAVALPDGRIWCAHNEASGDWASRSRLVISSTSDDGLTWQRVTVLEDGVAEGDGTPVTAAATGVVTDGVGEFSYPAMVVVGDEVWLTWSWQRRSIAFERLVF